MLEEYTGGRMYDMITGERIGFGDRIMDTEIKTASFNPVRNNRTMFIKESSIVWLAEKAGFTLTRSDEGDSGNTEVVDESDASTGGGETPLGTPPTGGSKAPKRRTNGNAKG